MSNKYLGHTGGLIGPVPENVIESKPDFRDYDQGGQYHNAYVTWFNKHLATLSIIPCEGWKPEVGREYVNGKDFKILRKADKVRLENDKEVITPGERFAVLLPAAAPEGNPDVIKWKGEDYIHKDKVQKMMVEFIAAVLEKGKIQITPGSDDYFRTLSGAPTDMFEKYFPAPVLPAGGEGGIGLTLKEFDAYFEAIYKNEVVKDAGNLWIAFTDKWNAFKKQLLQSPTYPAEFVEWASDNYHHRIMGWFNYADLDTYSDFPFNVNDGAKPLTTAELFTEWKRIKSQSK